VIGVEGLGGMADVVDRDSGGVVSCGMSEIKCKSRSFGLADGLGRVARPM
jgi:hypothetical protein